MKARRPKLPNLLLSIFPKTQLPGQSGASTLIFGQTNENRVNFPLTGKWGALSPNSTFIIPTFYRAAIWPIQERRGAAV